MILDEALLAEARRLTGVTEKTALVHEGLRALIAREHSARLRRLAGSDPTASVADRSRRRPRP
jgi:Arc/MetJ family transcription regulator